MKHPPTTHPFVATVCPTLRARGRTRPPNRLESPLNPAQYFIAILVGAFEEAKEHLREEESKTLTLKIPPDFSVILFQFLTGYNLIYREWSFALIRSLTKVLAEGNVSYYSLVRALGAEHASTLYARFDEEDGDCHPADEVAQGSSEEPATQQMDVCSLVSTLANNINELRDEMRTIRQHILLADAIKSGGGNQ